MDNPNWHYVILTRKLYLIIASLESAVSTNYVNASLALNNITYYFVVN